MPLAHKFIYGNKCANTINWSPVRDDLTLAHKFICGNKCRFPPTNNPSRKGRCVINISKIPRKTGNELQICTVKIKYCLKILFLSVIKLFLSAKIIRSIIFSKLPYQPLKNLKNQKPKQGRYHGRSYYSDHRRYRWHR